MQKSHSLADRHTNLWVETNLYRVFFYRFFIYVLSLDIQLSRGEDWGPIYLLKPQHVVPVQAKIWISSVICRCLCLCSVSSDDRWLFIFWHWWNCWPSLFKLSVLNWLSIDIISTMCDMMVRFKLENVHIFISCQ